MKGTLYIVSTPVGNLEDITLRALRVLKEVDLIAAEDIRHSLKLLNHYGISKPMVSYWREKEKVRSAEILARILDGQSVALISDAGTPGISDPGALVIRKAIDEGVSIVSVPGPTACIAALSISGLPADEFTFIGFLPSRQNQRLKRLKSLVNEKRTLLLYESPHRILRTLEDMRVVFTDRAIAVAKEITKIHEHVIRGSVPEVEQKLKDTTIAGEYVIIVEGSPEAKQEVNDETVQEVRDLMKKGIGRKEAVRIVAGISGVNKKDLYRQSIG